MTPDWLGSPQHPVNLAVDAVDSGVVYVALYTLVQVLTLSLTALFGTLMYFSLRAQKEHPFPSAPATTWLPPIPGGGSHADRPAPPPAPS